MVELKATVEVRAPAERVFSAMTNWERQGEWMPGTRLHVTKGSGTAVGDEFVARTAVASRGPLGRVGFNDPMRITAWESPLRCEVLHLGRVVKGTGAFLVEPLADGGSRYVWIEWVDAPWGRVGEIGLRLGSRVAELALGVALRRFARWVEAQPS